jgi:tetratricopeptide (TPR) repeat protein
MAALALRPDSPGANVNLGAAQFANNELDDAIACFQKAIRLKSDYAAAHYDLGMALARKGNQDRAIACFQEAIRLKPDFFEAHNNLGAVLKDKGELDKAIACFEQAIRLNREVAEFHFNLGKALRKKGELDRAIACQRKGLSLKADPVAYYNLGIWLNMKDEFDEAITCYEKAIALKYDYAEAYCNLAGVLREKGRFKEALDAMRHGHDLGTRRGQWRYPTAKLIPEYEKLVELEAKLPDFFAGVSHPASVGECLMLARMCLQYKQLPAAAARWYEEAFSLDARLADPGPWP